MLINPPGAKLNPFLPVHQTTHAQHLEMLQDGA